MLLKGGWEGVLLAHKASVEQTGKEQADKKKLVAVAPAPAEPQNLCFRASHALAKVEQQRMLLVGLSCCLAEAQESHVNPCENRFHAPPFGSVGYAEQDAAPWRC